MTPKHARDRSSERPTGLPPGYDPAVIAWRLALAPRPRYSTGGRHWWRDFVTDSWRSAHHAWWLHREAVAVGYATEMREFEEKFPQPNLKDFMVQLSSGSRAPAA